MRWLFFMAMFLSAPCLANLSLAELQTLTRAPDHLTGQFEQQKYLQGLDVTLSSSGKFDYRRGESIEWETLHPIHNRLRMTPARISSHQGDTELLVLDSASNPAVKILSDIFFSVLMAEWRQLTDYFELTGETSSESEWHVVMKPVSETVRQVVEKVELDGDGLLRQVILFEANGDRTTIRFHPDSIAP